jgi:hypothetical protein
MATDQYGNPSPYTSPEQEEKNRQEWALYQRLMELGGLGQERRDAVTGLGFEADARRERNRRRLGITTPGRYGVYVAEPGSAMLRGLDRGIGAMQRQKVMERLGDIRGQQTAGRKGFLDLLLGNGGNGDGAQAYGLGAESVLDPAILGQPPVSESEEAELLRWLNGGYY